jgi:transposase
MEKVCEKCKPFFEELKKKIEELEKKLKAYENAHTPSSQSKRKYPKREPTGNPVGAPKNHKGITRKKREPNNFVDVAVDCCINCGGKKIKKIGSKTTVIEDTPPPQKVTVTQYNRDICQCEDCNKITIADHTDIPDEGNLGHNLMSEVVLMKYEDRLPLRKIAKNLIRRYDFYLTPAAILELLQRATRKCEPEYEKLKIGVKNSKSVNGDETSQKVQGRRWWNWVFATLNTVLFLLRNTRGQEPIKEVLGEDYKGVLGCDGWKPYTIIKLIQRCWAHLIREAKWLMQNKKRQAKRFYRRLCELYNWLLELLKKPLAERVKKKTELENELLELVKWGRGYSVIRPLANKIANGEGQWFTCLEHENISPTNNKAEQELREFVVQRKITGTLRSEKGTHAIEVLLSLIQTWKRRKLF